MPASPWGPSPPFSPSPFGQFPLAANAPPGLPPNVDPGGIFSGIIGRMIAEQAKANDPLERLAKTSILGDIPRTISAQAAANDPWSAVANGPLGDIAKLQPSSLDNLSSSQWSPLSVGLDGLSDSSIVGNELSGQSIAPPPALIPPSSKLPAPNPTPSSLFQRTGLTSGDGDQSTRESASGSLLAPDFMASLYMSGGSSGHPTNPLGSTGWDRVQVAAGDREKIDPEDIFDPLAPLRVDLYNVARFDLRQIQPNNYALSVPSLRAPGGAPTIDEIGELKYAYRIALSTQPLADTASRTARLIEPFAWNFRTVSVLQTSKGIIVAPSGDVELEPDQIAAIKAMGATDIAAGGVDAEIAAFEYAKNMGATPQFIAASRPFCTSCREAIRGRGGFITSPTTAVFPRNIPSVAFPLR
jgi:hypothetical protein